MEWRSKERDSRRIAGQGSGHASVMKLMGGQKIILTLGEFLGYVYGIVALRIYL